MSRPSSPMSQAAWVIAVSRRHACHARRHFAFTFSRRYAMPRRHRLLSASERAATQPIVTMGKPTPIFHG